VPIELDCKQVVDNISSNINTNSMFDAILNGCKASLMNHQNFKISFIKRQANNVVHVLVRASLSYTSFMVHDYITSCITTIFINEIELSLFQYKKNITFWFHFGLLYFFSFYFITFRIKHFGYIF